MGTKESAAGNATTSTEGSGASSGSPGTNPLRPEGPLGPGGAPPKGPTGRAVGKTRKGRGNKLPSPKKIKKARQADAIKQVAGKGEAAGPLGGLGGAERVVDTAENAARWVQERWQLLAAAALLALCLTAFVSWRVRASHRHEALGFHKLEALLDGADAKKPAGYEALLDQFAGTEVAPFIRLALAEALLKDGTAASGERAAKIFREVKAEARPESASRFSAERGLRLYEIRKAFDPAKVDLDAAKAETVPNLAPLPAVPASDKPASDKPAPDTPAASSPEKPVAAGADPAATPKAPAPAPVPADGAAPKADGAAPKAGGAVPAAPKPPAAAPPAPAPTAPKGGATGGSGG